MFLCQYTIFRTDFHICTLHLDIIIFIYTPTDALVNCLKKTILKFTWKQLRDISVLQLHHNQGAH